MTAQKTGLPCFMKHEETRKILSEAVAAVPKDAKVYLTGGALRNAVYYHLFGKQLLQRDYDLIVITKRKEFIKRLRARGFTYGRIRRKMEVVLRKRLYTQLKNKHNDYFNTGYVHLDIHFSSVSNIKKNLSTISGFTINAFALPLSAVTSKKWFSQLIAIPEALKHIRSKQLRVKNLSHPAMLYACIRFMSLGFKAPPKDEVQELLQALSHMPTYKFERNKAKCFRYVGGEKKARALTKKLGIKIDIFDLSTLKKLRSTG